MKSSPIFNKLLTHRQSFDMFDFKKKFHILFNHQPPITRRRPTRKAYEAIFPFLENRRTGK